MTSTISGFTPAPDAIATRAELGPTAALVWGRVWRYSQGELGKCTATQPRLANDLGISLATLKRHLSSLVEEGYLHVVRTGRANIYEVTDKLQRADGFVERGVTMTHQIAQPELHKIQEKIQESVRGSQKQATSYSENPKKQVEQWARQKFKDLTKLTVPSRQSEAQIRWYSPIRDICEMGEWDQEKISSLMVRAIEKMQREDKLQPSAPQSVMYAVRIIHAEDQGGGNLSPGQAFRAKYFGT